MKEKETIRTYFNFVRAAAILGIYFYHFYDFSYGGFGSIGRKFQAGILQSHFAAAAGLSDYLWGLCQLAFSFGNKGVELFIVASGFGLYLSYLEKRTPWKTFFKMRVLRVLPLYWAACVAIYLIFPVTAKHLVHNLLLIQIFTPEYLVFGPMWFISYLFLLYIMFPFLVMVFRNPYLKWGLFAASFFLTPLWEGMIVLFGYKPVGVAPTAYLSVFLVGMLLADSFNGDKPLHRIVLHPATGAFALVAFAVSVYLVSYRIALTPLVANALGILLFLSLAFPFAPIKRFRLFKGATERIAYGAYTIYLTHMLIFINILLVADSSPWLRKVLIYPIAEISRSSLKFFSTAIVLLAVVLLASLAIQKAYDRLVTGFVRRPEGKPSATTTT